jgi:uncharacterized protein YcfJ
MGIKHWLTAAVTTGLACASTFAQEQARVLSAIPVMQQVGVPQQFCENEQVYSGQRTNGTGAIIGAVVGGVAGNTLGRSSGRPAPRGYYSPRGYHGYDHHSYRQGSDRGVATIVGAIAGGLIGNVIESSNSQPRYETVRRCTNETVYENRTIGYDVTYEYAGRRYITRTDSYPGAWLPINVQPQAENRYSYPPTTSAGHFSGPSGIYQPAPANMVVTNNIASAQLGNPYGAAPTYPVSPASGHWR